MGWLEDYELTDRDRAAQAATDELADLVRRSVDQAPPLTGGQMAKLRTLLAAPPPGELRRWRVRLFCGHIRHLETHVTVEPAPRVPRRCPTCGAANQTVVASESAD
jgi:hypothetical protein